MATHRHPVVREEIKWIRLQEICLDLAGPAVILHVHGSTDVPADLRAAVSREGHRVDILMNLFYNKNLEDVINRLAHEMAHIVLGCEDHGLDFDRRWAVLRRKITREYRLRGQQHLIMEAASLAHRYHGDQRDYRDRPTIEHVQRVAGRVLRADTKTVAWLHDVLEDTEISEDELRHKFPSKIVRAVKDLTRHKAQGEEYGDYIQRLSGNPLAVAVKIADLRDHLDPELALPPGPLKEELELRYTKALEFLLPILTKRRRRRW